MTAPAAIKGKLVKIASVGAHKSAVLTIHIPDEEALEAIAAFGWPTLVDPVEVAIARTGVAKVARSVAEAQAKQPEPPAKERRRFSELPPTRQSALKCKDQAFQKFITEYNGSTLSYGEDETTAYVRGFCIVKSRSELNTNPKAAKRWQHLLSEFNVWMHEDAVI